MAATPESLKSKPMGLNHQLRIAASKGQVGVVQTLITQKADVNAIALGDPPGSGSKRSALHWAALGNHTEVAGLLIKAGANPLLEDNQRKTAIQLASDQNHTAMVELLKKESTIDFKEVAENIKTLITTDVSPKEAQKLKLKEIIKRVESFLSEVEASVTSLGTPLSEYEKLLRLKSGEISSAYFNKKTLDELTSQEKEQANKIFKTYLYPPASAEITNYYLAILQNTSKNFLRWDSSSQNIFLNIFFIRIISATIDFKRNFEASVKKSLEHLKTYVKDKTIAASLEKMLAKFAKAIQAQTSTLFDSFTQKFNPHSNITEFYEFMDEYFPGEFIHFFNSKTTDTTSNIPVILRQIALYYKNTIKKIMHLVAQERTQTGKHTSIYNTSDPTGNEPAICAILRTVENLSSIFETEKPEKINIDWKNASPPLINTFTLYFYYFHCRNFFDKIQELINLNKTLSESTIEKRCQKIREAFLESLASGSFSLPVDHATQLEMDSKKSREISAERESKAREEAQAQREAEMTALYQQALLEKKKQAEQEQEALAKEQFRKQFLSDLSPGDKKAVVELLTNPKLTLSKRDYLSLIVALKVPGYETITSDRESASGNSAVFHAGKFYTFTYHSPHGKKDKVDPANIEHLRKLLASVDINKDNFEEWTKKLRNHL